MQQNCIKFYTVCKFIFGIPIGKLWWLLQISCMARRIYDKYRISKTKYFCLPHGNRKLLSAKVQDTGHLATGELNCYHVAWCYWHLVGFSAPKIKNLCSAHCSWYGAHWVRWHTRKILKLCCAIFCSDDEPYDEVRWCTWKHASYLSILVRHPII